jgi:hypothetical protein
MDKKADDGEVPHVQGKRSESILIDEIPKFRGELGKERF